MIEATLASAFLFGLSGGIHCAGMCGGIVGAMSLRRRSAAVAPRASAALAAVSVSVAGSPDGATGALGARSVGADATRLLAYNTGRIASYVLAGALAGGVGSAAWVVSRMLPIQQVAFALTSLILILLGLHLLGVGGPIAWLESAGQRAWRRVAPRAAKVLRAEGVGGAMLAGAVWGMVPCGMVYGVLLAALSTGSPAQGAALMAAFGLGTLPNLLFLGFAGGRVGTWLRRRWVRVAAGSVIIAFGVAGLLRIDTAKDLHELAALCVSGLHSLTR
ncbi:MAG: sulfite exporter TauE/SafE family protein [Burkholderiaceae bacterium]